MIIKFLFYLTLITFSCINSSEPKKELPFLRPKISSCKYTGPAVAMCPEEMIGFANAQFLKEKRESLLKDIDGDKTRHKLGMLSFKQNMLKIAIDFCCVREPNIVDTIYVSDHNTMAKFSYRDSALSLMPSLDQFDKIGFNPVSTGKPTDECILVYGKDHKVYETGIELQLGVPKTGIKTWTQIAATHYDITHPIREKFHCIASSKLIEHCKACHRLQDFTALSKCARCESAFYCNRDCQVKDWKEHKRLCKK